MSDFTPRQLGVFDRLPDEPGWYWCSDADGSNARPVMIDKGACTGQYCYNNLIMRDGPMGWTGADQNISIIERWLEKNIILGPIRPPAAKPQKGMRKLQEDIEQTDLVKLEKKVKQLIIRISASTLENDRLEEALRHSHQRIQELDMIGRNVRNNHAKTIQELVERIDDLERENKRLMTDNTVLKREATVEPW